MKRNLDARLLKQFLLKAGEMLEGRWLLIGGTLLPALGIDLRATVDIDLIGLDENASGAQLKLMDLAEGLGLPVDTVNQAASYFLNKAGYSDKDLIELQRGPRALIFRPSAALYLRLKVARLTEADLEDCAQYVQFCIHAGDAVDVNALSDLIAREVAKRPVGERRRRLNMLIARVRQASENAT